MNFFQSNSKISQAEKEIQPLLIDDGIQVLSSFELNKIASLTYSDSVCDDIFELIEKIIAKPLESTPYTLQKTLVVLKHILIYGSEKCVNSTYGIGRFVEDLMKFNTILAAQQQQGMNAFFQRIQGGGVDKGGPVREAAEKVHKLLGNIHELQRIRNESASKNSLVPIGDNKIAFVTDEVRHYILKKKIEQQARIEIKSNLAKSEGGFGGGYSAQNGKQVVGAAHGIEEMLKMAKREKKKFSDDGLPAVPSEEDKILRELMEAHAQKEAAEKSSSVAMEGDLLGSTNGGYTGETTSNEVDLLDFGSTATATTTMTTTTPNVASHTTGDLLGVTSSTSNLLGSGEMLQQPQSNSLLDLIPPSDRGDGNPPQTTGYDPFAALPMTSLSNTTMERLSQTSGMTELSGRMGSISMGSVNNASNPIPAAVREDPFSAFDALTSTNNNRLTAAPTPSLNSPGMSNTSIVSSAVPSTGFVDNVPSFSQSYMNTTMIPATMSNTGGGGHHVAATYGKDYGKEDIPWVMGGSSGTGLQPIGEAPAAPPPPPPPP